MLTNFIIYSGGAGLILLVQTLISRILEKTNKSESAIRTNFMEIAGFSVFFGLFFSLASEFTTTYINYQIIIIILICAFVPSYWFFISPIFYLFRKRTYVRDFQLEKQLQSEGFTYKVLFSNEIKENAYCTGILPHARLIIVANSLKTNLDHDELKTIIYHEIGHHERKHIVKLLGISIILNTIYYFAFHTVLSMDLSLFYEFIAVAVVGGAGGLMFYYIPNKILYHLEYEADIFSARQCGKEDLSRALVKFDEFTNGDLTRGNINHPNLKKRLKNIERSA